MSQQEHKLSAFPAFFRVENKAVLVVGSGAEALAKIRLLTQTSARIVAVAPSPAPHLYDALKELTRTGASLTWLDAPFDKAMLEGAVLVFAATGDLAQDRAVADMARRSHVPVNVVDRPQLCDFFTPALVNRAPVAVAIGSEGTGPVLAQLIRMRIETLLSPRTGRLARFAAQFRDKVEMHVARGASRRRFWQEFFTGGVAQAIYDANETAAGQQALKLLATEPALTHPVRFLYAGHAGVEWLTVGGQRALMEADIIIYDRDVADDILAMARRDADRQPAASSLPATAGVISALAGQGRHVLRLVTDDSRLAEEARLLATRRIGCEMLPALPSGVMPQKHRAGLAR